MKTTGSPLRVMIVDDEPLARMGLRELLEDHHDVEIIGEYGDGREAVEAIPGLSPDLLFLDIQMPEVDGFGVVGSIGPEEMPAVIFVTAFDQFAVRAFEIHALDYILKPIDPARLSGALDRARARVLRGETSMFTGTILRALRDLSPSGGYPERILVKEGERMVFLRTGAIEWIEAQGDYVMLHTREGNHLLRSTMAGIGERLDPARFCRIHRSTIVNIDCVRELHPLFSGEYSVHLGNGTKLVLSRSYKATVLSRLGNTGSGE